MRSDTKILLVCGGLVYALTTGGVDLLIRALASAGVYAGNQSISYARLQKSNSALASALAKLPEGQRKALLQEVQAKMVRDMRVVTYASMAFAVGTFISPPIGMLTLAVASGVSQWNSTREQVLRREKYMLQAQRVVEAKAEAAKRAEEKEEETRRPTVDGVLVG